MSAGDLITSAWQIEMQGLLLGAGTSYVVRGFNPWAAPVVRPGDQARSGQHGVSAGEDWLGERPITIDVLVRPSTDAAEQAARRLLAGAFRPLTSTAVVPLVWMEDDGVRYQLFGKPRAASSQLAPTLPTEARFLATDPRIYAAAAKSLSAALPTLSGGLTFPAAAPFVFGAAGAGGAIAATNDGTIDTPWVITFTGPLVAPTVEHTAQSRTLSLSGATLAAGETVVIDSAARTVLLNGTTSRYSWLSSSSQWWTLEPGANALRFGAASGSGTCQVAYRDAWL
jgi:hypothetical protein